MTKGYVTPWITYKCLNRLHTEYTCSKTQRKKWTFYTGHTTCSCGRAEESTAHMLKCSQLTDPCSLDDLITNNYQKFKELILKNITVFALTTKQMEQETHSLFGHIPARSHLKSRKDFLTSVKPSNFPEKVV